MKLRIWLEPWPKYWFFGFFVWYYLKYRGLTTFERLCFIGWPVFLRRWYIIRNSKRRG